MRTALPVLSDFKIHSACIHPKDTETLMPDVSLVSSSRSSKLIILTFLKKLKMTFTSRAETKCTLHIHSGKKLK